MYDDNTWFLKYKAQQTVFYHFEPFLTFEPPNNLKNQQLKKMKKNLEILIYTCMPQMTSYDVYFLIYGVWQTIFCHLAPFFARLP